MGAKTLKDLSQSSVHLVSQQILRACKVLGSEAVFWGLQIQ